jgi:hypothetical protein
MKRDGLDPSAPVRGRRLARYCFGATRVLRRSRSAAPRPLKTFDWPQNQGPPVHAEGHFRVNLARFDRALDQGFYCGGNVYWMMTRNTLYFWLSMIWLALLLAASVAIVALLE